MQDKVEGPVFQKLLGAAIDHTRIGVIITDPVHSENPIIYANQGFQDITGYQKEEIIGFNCRFLQGEDTEEDSIGRLRSAISNIEPISLEILNYRKDGEPFWNELHIDPVYIEEKNQYFFVGVQKDITEHKRAQDELVKSMNEITALSTPIVPLTDKISVLPLIGNIDGERLTLISDKITEQMSSLKHEVLIVELSGLTHFDEDVIRGIYRLSDLLQLLGATLMITGISSEFAIQSTQLGVNLETIQSFSSVKEALKNIQTESE